MAVIDFGGVKEKVVTRKEFPLTKARKVLKNETIAIIGYGVQGPAQALNLKDNGFQLVICLRIDLAAAAPERSVGSNPWSPTQPPAKVRPFTGERLPG